MIKKPNSLNGLQAGSVAYQEETTEMLSTNKGKKRMLIPWLQAGYTVHCLPPHPNNLLTISIFANLRAEPSFLHERMAPN